MNKRLVINTALLTGSSIIMRCIAMAFQVWLVGRIGAAGIGLYQLVMSVEMLCVTFAVSGIRFAVTRLVSEEIGLGRPGGVSSAMRRCVMYSLFFGFAAMALLYTGAEPIGFLWIGDARTVLSLKILALGLPFISLSSALSGYFTACGRVLKPSIVHLVEQVFYVGLVGIFLSFAPEGDIEKSCAAVTAGVTASDIISFLMMLAAFWSDRRKHAHERQHAPMLTRRMLGVALPLAASSYARGALSTLEQLLVPRGFKKSGQSADRALASYGVIQGMVMPILSFPACILMAAAELIVPELTEKQMKNDDAGISRVVGKLIKTSVTFSVAAAAFLFFFSNILGVSIYRSSDAGHFIRMLAPLVPIMYTDMVVDGCLKGLGQQIWSMGVNILDAALGVILVWTLLPRGAIDAYIAIIYFDELLNFAFSAGRLWKVTRKTRASRRQTCE